MKTLLVNGATYTLRLPQREEDLAREVEEHVKDLFGEDAFYFNLKKRIRTPAEIAAIPDAYVIVLADKPQWYVIEVELASHPLYEHVIPQVNKFIQGLKNPHSRDSLVKALYDAISSDPMTQAAFKTRAHGGEIYKLLSDLLSKNPTFVIPIDQATSVAKEACANLPTEANLLELSTFVGDPAGSPGHAHLYEPLRPAVLRPKPQSGISSGHVAPARHSTVNPYTAGDFKAQSRAPETQQERTQLERSTAGEDPPRQTFRKRPELNYPDGYESIRESAKRLARMLNETEQNIYAQLWRKRHSLSLKKDSSGALEPGPKGSHLMAVLSDDELKQLWNDLKPTRPPIADSEHLSIAKSSLALGFWSRGALGRKVRRNVPGWEPDCKIHQYCYTPKRIEEIRNRFELCSNDEKKSLLSPKQVHEVFEELGIKKDRHFIAKYTSKGQLHYAGKSPGQVTTGLQYYYSDDDIVAFIRHYFHVFSKDTKPIEEAIRQIRLRYQPLHNPQ